MISSYEEDDFFSRQLEWIILFVVTNGMEPELNFECSTGFTPLIVMIEAQDLSDYFVYVLQRADYYVTFKADEPYILAALGMNVTVLYPDMFEQSLLLQFGLPFSLKIAFQDALLQVIQKDRVRLYSRPWLHKKYAQYYSLPDIPDQTVLLHLLETLNLVTPIFWGRSGTLLIHSLLDSHPQVLSAGGKGLCAFMKFYSSTWPQMVQMPYKSFSALVDSFCQIMTGSFEEDKLGAQPLFDSDDQYFIEHFRHVCSQILEIYFQLLGDRVQGVERKVFLISAHIAYSLCIGEPVDSKKIIAIQLHGPENFQNLAKAKQDFLNMKVIGMIRCPMRGFYSILSHRVQYSQFQDPNYTYRDLIYDGRYIQEYRHILMGWLYTQHLFSFDLLPIRLESLHDEPEVTLRKMASWLTIDWSHQLLESTVDGIPFEMKSGVHGKVTAHQAVFDPQRTRYDKWLEHFSHWDQFVLEGIMFDVHQEYQLEKVLPFQKYLARILLFMPTKLEREAFVNAVNNKNINQIQSVCLTVLERFFYSFLYIFGYYFMSTVKNWEPSEQKSDLLDRR